MYLALVLFALMHFACDADAGGGGKASKHDVLKIHVPEIIKHQYHTHYVFIHKHPPKKPKKKEHHHHHKHVHIPHGGHHHHKHWYGVHKSTHNHKSGHSHGHGHPVVKTIIKHHKAPPPHMKHKPAPHPHPHPKPHHPHKKHKMKHPPPPPPKKPHDYYPFNHDSEKNDHQNHGYEVTEENEPSYEEHGPEYSDDGEGHVEDYGYEEENGYSNPYFSYPPNMGQYGNTGITSYDISPYYQVDGTKNHEFIDDKSANDPGKMLNYEGESFDVPNFSYHPSQESFGENVPGYVHHHKQFLNEVNEGVHTTYNDGTSTKFISDNDEVMDNFSHNYGGQFTSHS